MYEVIKFFTDLQDDCHHYEVGDSYPREGVTVSERRIAQLAGNNNKQGVPLIKKVSGEDSKSEPVAEPEPVEEPKPKPKRGRKPKAKEE